jgi:hypothetical protein
MKHDGKLPEGLCHLIVGGRNLVSMIDDYSFSNADAFVDLTTV